MKNAIVSVVVAVVVICSFTKGLHAACNWTTPTGSSGPITETCGSVGIGLSTTPQATLHVFKSALGIGQRWEWAGGTNNANVMDFSMSYNNGVLPANPNGAYLTYINSAADFGIRTKPTGSANFIIGSTGHVGINTLATSAVAPASPLEIDVSSGMAYDPTNLDEESQIILANTNQTLNNTVGLSFNAGTGAGNQSAFIQSIFTNRANGSGAITFGTRNTTGVLAERMRISDAGSVGIGTTPAAGYALDVNGSIRASGSITGATVINAIFQDVAEWVPVGEEVSPGTVVVLSGKKSNEVIASSAAYDTSVAGVVSAQPGIVLGRPAANKAQIATTGRVKVRVDARSAPIQIGDLLVTSDVRGTAMKSQPVEISGRRFHQPGTIIGKALEPLQSGEAEILVLLSLQ